MYKLLATALALSSSSPSAGFVAAQTNSGSDACLAACGKAVPDLSLCDEYSKQKNPSFSICKEAAQQAYAAGCKYYCNSNTCMGVVNDKGSVGDSRRTTCDKYKNAAPRPTMGEVCLDTFDTAARQGCSASSKIATKAREAAAAEAAKSRKTTAEAEVSVNAEGAVQPPVPTPVPTPTPVPATPTPTPTPIPATPTPTPTPTPEPAKVEVEAEEEVPAPVAVEEEQQQQEEEQQQQEHGEDETAESTQIHSNDEEGLQQEQEQEAEEEGGEEGENPA